MGPRIFISKKFLRDADAVFWGVNFDFETHSSRAAVLNLGV